MIEGVEAFEGDAQNVDNESTNDVIEALIGLGYSKTEVVSTMKKLDITDEMSEEDILKIALANLS